MAMETSGALTLPDMRICLLCNTRPKAGSDDLCQACAERWFLRTTVRRTYPFFKSRLTTRRRHEHEN